MTRIPVIVSAKNEERAIGPTLHALATACEHAEARSTFTYDIRLVLDDTTDGTASVAQRSARVTVLSSSGGKVEAQRTGLRAHVGEPAPFAIFCDADVLPSEETLLALTELLHVRPDVQVATCPLRPLERLGLLVPETVPTHRKHGQRRADRLSYGPIRERMHYALFSAALVACRVAYVAERAFVRHVRRAPRDPWPAVEETKAW